MKSRFLAGTALAVIGSSAYAACPAVTVADAMGVSRITVYNYLNAIHR